MQKLLILSALPVTLILTLTIGKPMIKWLHKLKFGQHIREEGPESHKQKSGTPTIGGLMFLIPILIVTAVFSQTNAHTFFILFIILLITGVGFLDDFLIIYFKNNKGITPRQKLAGQILIGAMLGLYVFMAQENAYTEIPFTCYKLHMSWLIIPFSMAVFTATTNAVNLTDGLDGLAVSVTIVSLTGFAILTYLSQGITTESITNLTLASSAIGGCLGFLWFNSYPAQVFMGDTGSLGLGGIIAVLAILGHLELWLIILGFIYVMETVSVILQVLYFKRTKKRLFLMSPIHHHFELAGWKETQVVSRFYIVAIILNVLAVIAYSFCHGVV